MRDEQLIDEAQRRFGAMMLNRRTLLKRVSILGIGATALPSLLAACGSDNSSDSTSTSSSGGSSGSSSTASSGSSGSSGSPPSEPSGDIKPGGSLTIGLYLEPDNLDPAVTPYAVSHTIMMNIYDTLVWRAEDGSFVPGLAEKWEASTDGTEYTLTVRSDVKFHDGTDFNADAVKFFLDHIVDPASHSGYAAALLGPYDHTDVVDPTTAKVTFKFPFAPFLDGASQAFLGIPSPTAVKKDRDAFLHHPVGTGFMKFDEWVLKDHISLSKNPEYNWAPSIFGHKGPAYLDKITFRFYTDDPTRLAALESGDADMINRVAVSEMNRIKSDSKYELVSKFQPGLPGVLFLDTRRPPTDDLQVRKALNYATNREAVCKVGLFDTTKPAFGPLWESTPYYSEAAGEYKFDLDMAKKTLDDAGWKEGSDGIREKDGKKLSVNWAQTPTQESWAQLAQAQWREAGVDLQLNKMTSAAANQAIADDKANVFYNSWNASDPVILNNLFLSKNIDGGYAWSKFPSDDLDSWLNDAEQTLDKNKRTDLYNKIQKLIMDQALIVPVYGILMNDGIHAKFKGLKLDFRGYEWLYDVHQS